MARWLRWLGPLGVVLALVACGEDKVAGPGPVRGARLSLAFKVTTAPRGSAALMAVPLTDSFGNTLVIDSAQMVLREIEFERAESTSDCELAADEDDCEEVESGPFLVELPVDATSPEVVLNTTLPAGTWDEVEFDVHKVKSGGDSAEVAFLTEHPDLLGISIRVWGTFNGTNFTYTSDLDEEQEIELSPPLVVAEGATEGNNVTFSVNMDTWYRLPSGQLVDPASANEGGQWEDLVKENIKNSIEGFEDEDLDGEED